MFLCEPLSNPNNSDGIKTSSVSEQLAEMGVICPLKLVLNEHPAFGVASLTEDICTKWPNARLLALALQFHANGFTQ